MPSPRFQVWLTITGALAASITSTIKVPGAREVNIVYEKNMPLPRLWNNKKAGQWQPVDCGSSLFDPKWSLSQLESWAAGYAPPIKAPVILDIEDVHPWVDTMAADAKPNLDQLRRDLALRKAVSPTIAPPDDIIARALRDTWCTILDGLIARGLDVSSYGHPPRQTIFDTPSMRQTREWFYSRVRRTHPIIYTFDPKMSLSDHVEKIIRPRIRAARADCPLKPCYPFVTPLLDNGSGLMVNTEDFAAAVNIAKEEGAAGVVLWYHAQDTTQLTPWLQVVDKYINPTLLKAVNS